VFAKSICDRFDRETNFLGHLTKLRQTGTIKYYIVTFETLAIRKEGLGDAFYLECFISGLKEAIQAHVRMHHPPTWMDTFNKAIKVERTLAA